MERIYETAGDLHVRGIRAYVRADDEYAYTDSAFANKFGCDDLTDAFLMGQLLIEDESANVYRPVACAVVSNVATITYVTTAGVAATAKSE